MQIKKIALYSMFLSIALIVSYIERMVPSPIPLLPGIKLGLSNSIVLVLLYVFSARSAALVNGMRILLSGLLFSGVFGMMYAVFGAAISFTAMLLTKKTNVFGVIGVSVIGGVCHNFGQITLAVLVLGNPLLYYYYFPVLILSGVACGVIVGFTAGQIITHNSVFSLSRFKSVH